MIIIKYRIPPLLLLCCLVLCGCKEKAAPPAGTVPTAPPTLAPTAMETAPAETEPPILMYPGAIEDYLLPLEKFSWVTPYQPEYVMLHFTSAVMLAPEDPYEYAMNRQIFVDNKVSIHYLVDREGAVYCFIPEDRAAWHAGEGTFANDPKYTNKMNFHSIGIEIMGIGSYHDMAEYMDEEAYNALDPALIGFTDAQYEALRLLVADICQRYGIPMDRSHVIGHSDFAPDKTDPGELLDWERLLSSGE